MKYDNAMMKTAQIWAEESYCKRRQVGSVIARDDRIISIGFNGTISGHDNICEEFKAFEGMNELHDCNKYFVLECPTCKGKGQVGHMTTPHGGYFKVEQCTTCNGLGQVEDLNITNDFTLHAESNAITWAGQEGVRLRGSTMYITTAPCKDCAKLIAQVKIKKVVYRDSYNSEEGIDYLKKCNVEVVKHST